MSAAARGRVVLAAVATVAVALGLALGLLLAGSLLRPALPTDDSVDAGFARDMQVHHGQAVEMAVMVRESSQDEDVRRLALDILLTQQQQAGQMYGWLSVWGLPQVGQQPSMAWMAEGHGHGGDTDGPAMTMPGLVTDDQLAMLSEAQGAEADRIFLALMIPHHQGAVDMAEAAVETAGQPAVRRLAEAVILSQAAEISVLEQMLAERGGPPSGL